jgi:hypothetical protein
MSATIGAFDSSTGTVTVTFVNQGLTYKRTVRAILNTDGTYNEAATTATINQMSSGEAYQSDIATLAAEIPGGSLNGGGWVKLPALYFFSINGTGTVVLDSMRRSDDTITTAVVTFTATGVETENYYAFDPSIGWVRASFTGSATAQVV